MNQCINTIILLFQGGNCTNNDAPIQARNSSSLLVQKKEQKKFNLAKNDIFKILVEIRNNLWQLQ